MTFLRSKNMAEEPLLSCIAMRIRQIKNKATSRVSLESTFDNLSFEFQGQSR